MILEARAQESSGGGVFLELGEVIGIKQLPVPKISLVLPW